MSIQRLTTILKQTRSQWMIALTGVFLLFLVSAAVAENDEKKAEPKPAAKKTAQNDDTPKKEGVKKAGKKKKEEPKKEESKKGEPKKEEPKPDTLELKEEPFRLTVKINGTFESVKAETVQLKGEDFSTFELQEVVAHGSKVRKGDILIKFNSKKYEEALAEKKRALRLSEISLQEEEISLKYLEKRQPLRKEMMEWGKKQMDDDFVYFINVRKEWYRKMAQMWVKMYTFQVESAKEELRQLEKMYEDDDLIEDTEEFVLKRSKFYIEMYEMYLEMEKIDEDYMINRMIPRMETSMRFSAKMSDLEYRRSKETFDFALEQAKLRYAKTKETHAKLVEQFEKFAKDRDMLTLRAPADGIVYYGEYSGKLSPGKWNNAAQVASGMKIENNISNKQVLFTIVDPKPSRVRATVPEKELHWVDSGVKGTIAPTADPNKRYPVRVTKRNNIPTPANDYVALLSIELPEDSAVYPNMTGSVELVVYNKKEAILVPTASLKRDENEDDSWNHAYLNIYLDKKKRIKKVKVRTGNVKGDKTEILEGVSAGMNIFGKFDDAGKWTEKEKERKKKEAEEKVAKEKAEKEKAEKEKAEKEKAEKEKAEKEAAEKEAQQAKEKAEKEKKEKTERDKAKKEKAARKKAEKEKKADDEKESDEEETQEEE